MAVEEQSIWVGYAQVTPLPGSETLGSAKGAFVTVAAWAADVAGLREKAELLCRDLDLSLTALEDVETYASRLERGNATEELIDAAQEIEGDPQKISYTTFHTWQATDA